MARVRTFIGVDVGDEVRRRAVALQAQLAKTGAGVKWADPGGMHVTLLFLGDLDDRDVLAVCKAVEAVAATEPPFPLRVSGVGAFPTPRRPKVIWGGVTDGADPLRRLAAGLSAKMLDLGIVAREERAYTPHLTLGRVKGEADGQTLAPELPKLLAWDGGRCVVNEVLVYSSELRRDGPEYAVLGRGELARPAG
ncbi:MAG: RNA 2',3'-cyclic phosphodiesterase [Gemmataceae bacterium]|nr:RNA 2',3'-cyclic phosphodiesterase [Gemmataceae bacterium]